MLIDVAQFVIVDTSVDGVDDDVGRWEIIGLAFLDSSKIATTIRVISSFV